MPWLRVDDLFADHPKVEILTDREFRVHVRVLCYCARYKTRGRIPAAIWTTIRGLTRTMGDRFVEVGLWDKDDQGLSVHDWEKYNPHDPTKAERQARWRANRNADVDTHVDGDVDTPRDADVDLRARARARGPSPTHLKPVSNETRNGRYLCPECGIERRTERLLTEHLYNVHEIEAEA